MDKIKTVKGTHDIFGENSLKYDKIIEVAEKICLNLDYQKISTPILEYSNVFNKTLGDSSDVVSKEMYTFKDFGGDELTLRPEGTASIVRAVLYNALQQNVNQKFYYFGPMFRRERPQAGRLRQFHQFGIESINQESFFADVEVIIIAQRLMEKLNLKSFIQLQINTLGNAQSRVLFKEALKKFFLKYKNDLSDDSKIRLEKNVLRILDSKNNKDKSLLQDAPQIYSFLDEDSKLFFENIKDYLDQLNVKFTVNSHLVRGLDYYDHTTFEFISSLDQSQNTVLAGGRYNGLSEMLGGKKMPGVGWACGVERIALLMKNIDAKTKITISIFSTDEKLNIEAFKITESLKEVDSISFNFFFNGDLKKKMSRAHKINSVGAIIIGEEELKNEKIIWKDFVTGQQKLINRSKIKNFIESNF